MDLPKELEHLAVHYHLRLPEEHEIDEVVTQVIRSVQGNLKRTIQVTRARMGPTTAQA